MERDLRAISRGLKQQLAALKEWGVEMLPAAGASQAAEHQRTGQPRERSSNAVRVSSAKHGAARTGRPDEPGTPPPQETVERLRRLEEQVVACTRCPLYRTRTHHVFGEGSPRAGLVFVGEAPGREEDLQGRPFVGAAGQLLTRMIEAMGLAREAVYICNVLKDRPPDNRTPLPEEMEACVPFLIAQLDAIRPKVICALGAIATQALLGPGISIMKVRGQQRQFHETPVIPTFHPSYLLRNPSAKKLAWEDLKKVKRLLEERASDD